MLRQSNYSRLGLEIYVVTVRADRTALTIGVFGKVEMLYMGTYRVNQYIDSYMRRV